MIKFKFVIAALLLSANLSPLTAMSIGREGPSYIENEIEWQKVSYDNDDTGFTARIPGSPKSGLSGGDVYTYSNYRGVSYEINCSLNERYIAPKKENKFMNQVRNAFEKDAVVEAIKPNQKKVKYIAELRFNETNKICRIYCSKNCLYKAIVEGEDLSLAHLFFDSIQITE